MGMLFGAAGGLMLCAVLVGGTLLAKKLPLGLRRTLSYIAASVVLVSVMRLAYFKNLEVLFLHTSDIFAIAAIASDFAALFSAYLCLFCIIFIAVVRVASSCFNGRVTDEQSGLQKEEKLKLSDYTVLKKFTVILQ